MGPSYGGMTKYSCPFPCRFQRFRHFSQIFPCLVYKFVRDYNYLLLIGCLQR